MVEIGRDLGTSSNLYSQDAVGLLCLQGTLLAHVQPVQQHPYILPCEAAFQPASPQHGVMHFPLLNLMRVLSSHFSSLLRSL